ncbi:MAG: hypothetical protein ACI4Q3_08080 [Kiritimatiellia bacterium]
MARVVEFFKSLQAPWLFAAGAALCLSAVAVWWGNLNQDEGWYLYAAQMVRSGRFPYHDFFYTQGPAMPLVYSLLSPLWTSPASPVRGLLGGRILTLLFGFGATACAAALARRLVPAGRKGLAGLSVFALLGCNLYHLYFTAIPKTYALGSCFVLAGFLLLVCGVQAGSLRALGWFGPFAAGLLMAFATGTRISLLLILPVVGFTLLFGFRTFRWAFLPFGVGGLLGLVLTYGVFALDPVSCRSLLAAQSYHAARGGFDPFFAAGSVSRLVRGYAALVVVMFAAFCLRGRAVPAGADDRVVRGVQWMLGLGFAAVFLLQLSAPFPYDDYQVPLMGLLTVWVVSCYCRSEGSSVARAWFVLLAACAASFSSPLLQEWTTYGPDRFWSRKKPASELAQLRAVARQLDELDPGGTTLLTQDLYLAVETGRTVPPGFEMGPFCYFPDLSAESARRIHVMNRASLAELLDRAPCSAAALSGYAFAIAAPACRETPRAEQADLRARVERNYDVAARIPRFGQNATPLVLLTRKGAAK